MSTGDNAATIPGLTAEIVSAYLRHHPVATADIGRLVGLVAEGLAELGRAPEPPAGPEPAVPVRQSVQRDHLVCLVCGTSFKSLRRHLRTAHGLTPAGYRERFDLHRDYPMVAAAASEQRAAIARRNGLGRRGPAEPEAVVESARAAEAPPASAAVTPAPAAAAGDPPPAERGETREPGPMTAGASARPVRGRRPAPKAVPIDSRDPAQRPQPEPEPEPGKRRRTPRRSEPSPA